MIYTVLWQPVAERQLTALWTAAEDRSGVAAAADAIDALLRRNPLSVGESRDGGNGFCSFHLWLRYSPSRKPTESFMTVPSLILEDAHEVRAFDGMAALHFIDDI